VSEPTKDNPKVPKRSSRRKPAMEPLGWDEIVSQPGMGGYLSFLNGPIALPHLHPPAPVVVSDPAVVPSTDVATGPVIAGPHSTAVVASAPETGTSPVIEPLTQAGPGVISNPAVASIPDVHTVSGVELTPLTAPSAPGVISNPAVTSTPDIHTTSGVEPTPPIAPPPPARSAQTAPVVVSGPALGTIPGLGTTTRRPRIRKCAAAHDGHSLGEEVLYQALWKAAAAESADARIIVIGWRGMSQLCRMTPKNCKINTQRLIRKLALEVLSPYNTPESIGTTYRIFPSEAILRRRHAAGLEWVVRSRGVEFVDPATGIPVTAHLCGYVSEGTPPS
jgi:hypothetical protein